MNLIVLSGMRKDKIVNNHLTQDEGLLPFGNNLTINSNRILFCDYLYQWLEERKVKIQNNTYETYLGNIQNHIYPYFKGKGIYLDALTDEDIEKYYDYKLSSGLSNNTVIRHHANICTALKHARIKHLIFENPIDFVERPKPSKYIASYYTAEQLEELFEISKNYEIYPAILLAGMLGLRRSEVVGLKWESINFHQGTITIRCKAMKLHKRKEDIVTDKLKTEASYRTLPLPSNLLQYLSQLKNTQKTRENNKEYFKKDIAYVCLDKTGHRLRLNIVTGQFRYIIYKHDLDYIRFHDLRHSCASLLLKLNYSMKQIQEWLGHSNFVTTANIYAHVDLKDKFAMAEELDNQFKISF